MAILITGGTGLIGRSLTMLLLKQGHEVFYLSRKKQFKQTHVKVFQWDLDHEYIETGALDNVDYIIHLAGAGIADKRWTTKRKKEIIDSRIKPILILNKHLQKENKKIKAFISASGINYYGANTGEIIVDENSPVGDGFLANCCRLWEKETESFTQAERTVSLRTGIVLSALGGALPKMALPVKLGIGSPLGDGMQWIPWIHIDDICRLYLRCIDDNSVRGAYNAVAPYPIRNNELIKTIANVLKRPLLLPNVPSFALKLILGEMSVAVLGGNHAKNMRIVEELTFQYQFPDISAALDNLLK